MFFAVLGLSLYVLIISIGLLLIIGTLRKWPLMVDPPEQCWLVYSQSFIKKAFGRTGLVTFNYLVGCLFIFVGLLALWNVSGI